MDRSLPEALSAFAASLDVSLSSDQNGALSTYLDLLTTWNSRIRLTGTTEPQELWLRHVADCVAVASRIGSSDRFVDIGSGAGFPGIVVAIIRPDTTGVLIEPRRKRASFLSEVLRTIGRAGAIRVEACRAEEYSAAQLPAAFDVAVSRALRLDLFGQLATPLLKPRGELIAMDTGVEAAPVLTGFDSPREFRYRLPIEVSRRLLLYQRLC